MATVRGASRSLRAFVRAFPFLAVVATSACSHESAPPADASNASTERGTAPSSPDGVAAPGGASVFVVHEIQDFDAFKKYLDEGAAEREKAGVKGYLLTKLDDGRVVVHFFAEKLAEVKAALDSPELQRYLNRAGAPEASLVWLASDEVVRVPASPPTGKTYSLFYKLKTADFAAFKRAFEGRFAVYAEQGVIAEGLHRSVSNDDMLFVHFVGTDREKLAALQKRPEFVELLALAGGADAAKPLLGEDVARSRPK
ncbi:MAG TPA: hypothetical protein VF103_04455 [Polyangiaceae bacterium]